MSEKRFFEIEYNETYYIVDSAKLKRKKDDFDDEEDFLQYIIENSMSGEEILEVCNENELLKERIRDYEVILTIADKDTLLCEHQQIEDIAYYCNRYKDYRCYPNCSRNKKCFKVGDTFQGKLEDLKRFWGDKWYGEE